MEEENMCDITTRDPNAYLVVVDIENDGSAKAKAFYRPADSTRMPYPPSSSTNDTKTGIITNDQSTEETNNGSKTGNISHTPSSSSLMSGMTQNTWNQGGQLKRRTRRRVTRSRQDRHRRHIRSRRTSNKRTRY
jgi:hypothetical protein